MIAMPVGVRVWLANGHTDMRRRVEVDASTLADWVGACTATTPPPCP